MPTQSDITKKVLTDPETAYSLIDELLVFRSAKESFEAYYSPLYSRKHQTTKLEITYIKELLENLKKGINSINNAKFSHNKGSYHKEIIDLMNRLKDLYSEEVSEKIKENPSQ